MPGRIFLTTALLCLLISKSGLGQAPARMTSGEIHAAIEKLGVVGSALYVAAHPDDENTRLISYLANETKVNTTYLSMTRGDGGQNLVGPEIREYLGIIRTQELMMAREIDGGNQLFTRANDFGYSKTPEETLDFWNEEEVLADVVWAIRKTRPDVIFNRFPHEHLNGNHGHHTTSAMLSFEAFDLAGDPNAYPEQLEYVDVWQPERLFFNTSWWFYGSREKFDEADKARMAGVDVGVYFPQKGLSNSEIAAMSRSMHKSQGFGSSGSRGRQIEYLELIKGDMPDDKSDVFDGIDLTWKRLGDHGHIDKLIEQIHREYDHERPYSSIPDLVRLKDRIMKVDQEYWKEIKLEEIDKIIQACAGIYVDVRADDYRAAPGDSIELEVEVTNRADIPVTLKQAKFDGRNLIEDDVECPSNSPFEKHYNVGIAKDANYTSPYWLRKEGTLGMYSVEDQRLRGLPENKRELGVTFSFQIGEASVEVFRPVVYQTTDPVIGEVYRPFEIVPPVFVNFSESIQIIADDDPRNIEVRVKSALDDVKGEVAIETSEGWKVEPPYHSYMLDRKGDEAVYTFKLLPPTDQNVGSINATVTANGQKYDHALVEIDYDHIPAQTVLEKASAKVVRIDLKRAGNKIAYIMGAGDEIPANLRQVGYEVDELDENAIDLNLLKQYDAVVLGIRLYNVSERIRHYQKDLFEYVSQGGTLITQYNTSRGLMTGEVAPLPLELSRQRVTDETAEVTVLAPDHPVMHYPNEITTADFDMWVQERGLYFPDEWDQAFKPILGMSDPGEEPATGSLLIAPYGEGHFVYTSLSWFRELPAGVPGAYRLFTNLLSLGNGSKS